jgi:hypothetical protein
VERTAYTNAPSIRASCAATASRHRFRARAGTTGVIGMESIDKGDASPSQPTIAKTVPAALSESCGQINSAGTGSSSTGFTLWGFVLASTNPTCSAFLALKHRSCHARTCPFRPERRVTKRPLQNRPGRGFCSGRPFLGGQPFCSDASRSKNGFPTGFLMSLFSPAPGVCIKTRLQEPKLTLRARAEDSVRGQCQNSRNRRGNYAHCSQP